MCTVSWSYASDGTLAVCFNRDEQHTRAESLPPRVWPGGFLAPVDTDAGGTWLAVRQDGTVLALLNHYPSEDPPLSGGLSRGAVIPALAGLPVSPRLKGIRAILTLHPNPFRLLVLPPFGTSRRLFTWDGARLTAKRIRTPLGMLTSSSWNTAKVVASRQASFRLWKNEFPAPHLADLQCFHRQSQHPRGTAWAVCMKREDARSVSLNSILLRHGTAAMTHQLRRPGEAGFSTAITSMEIILVPPL